MPVSQKKGGRAGSDLGALYCDAASGVKSCTLGLKMQPVWLQKNFTPIPNATPVVALEIGGCNLCVIGFQSAWLHQESEDATFLQPAWLHLALEDATLATLFWPDGATCVIS